MTLAEFKAWFEIERMADGAYWMALYKDKARQVIVIHGQNPRAKVVARTEAE